MCSGTKHLVAAEGKVVCPTQYDAVAKVEIRIPPISLPPVLRVLRRCDVTGAARIVDAVSVCVRGQRVENIGYAVSVSHLEGVECGVGALATLVDGRKAWVLPARGYGPRARSRLVDIGHDQHVGSRLAGVSNRQHIVARQLTLEIQSVFIRRGVFVDARIIVDCCSGSGERRGTGGRKAHRSCRSRVVSGCPRCIGYDIRSVEGSVGLNRVAGEVLVRIIKSNAATDHGFVIEGIRESNTRPEIGVAPVCYRVAREGRSPNWNLTSRTRRIEPSQTIMTLGPRRNNIVSYSVLQHELGCCAEVI